MVRKLNESKCYHRVDQNCIKLVSDNKVEVDLPDINLFMSLAVNPSENLPLEPLQRGPNNLTSPATGTNTTGPIETPVTPLQDTSDIVWKWSVVGNVEPASIVSSSLAKISSIDFHALGPIYCIDEVSK